MWLHASEPFLEMHVLLHFYNHSQSLVHLASCISFLLYQKGQSFMVPINDTKLAIIKFEKYILYFQVRCQGKFP